MCYDQKTVPCKKKSAWRVSSCKWKPQDKFELVRKTKNRICKGEKIEHKTTIYCPLNYPHIFSAVKGYWLWRPRQASLYVEKVWCFYRSIKVENCSFLLNVKFSQRGVGWINIITSKNDWNYDSAIPIVEIPRLQCILISSIPMHILCHGFSHFNVLFWRFFPHGSCLAVDFLPLFLSRQFCFSAPPSLVSPLCLAFQPFSLCMYSCFFFFWICALCSCYFVCALPFGFVCMPRTVVVTCLPHHSLA